MPTSASLPVPSTGSGHGFGPAPELTNEIWLNAVAQGNDRATWAAYKNRYCPTLYLINKRGQIRYVDIGEGPYEITESVIQELLAESYP